jgi:hypothetical protein
MTSLCPAGMDGRDEIRVTGEGLQGVRLIPPEQRGDVVLLHLQSGQLVPASASFRSRCPAQSGSARGQRAASTPGARWPGG